jgi:hypothetical protein
LLAKYPGREALVLKKLTAKASQQRQQQHVQLQRQRPVLYRQECSAAPAPPPPPPPRPAGCRRGPWLAKGTAAGHGWAGGWLFFWQKFPRLLRSQTGGTPLSTG